MRPRRLRARRTPIRAIRRSVQSAVLSMSFVQAHYHPFLFTMMLLTGIAELGLTAFLVNAGNAAGKWPSPRYHSLLLVMIFNAAWTVLFAFSYLLWLVDGSKYILANVASSIAWMCVTAVMWGVSAGIFHFTRTGGICPTSPPISRCRQSLTVECLAWSELAVTALALLCTCVWAGSERRSVQDSRRMV